MRNFCSPQHTDSALYPTIGQIERAAGFTHDETLQAKLDKLDALLAQSSTSGQDAALFAEMLSLPNDGRYPVLELTPQQRRQKTLEALALQVAALTSENPVLMVFEDAQWIDPTSLELFSRIVERIPTLRVLLIMTYRPEFQPPWLGRPYVTALTINRLTGREAGAMIDRIAGNKPLPAGVRRDIIERSDGIPLFVEEITKAALEAGSESEAEYTSEGAPALPAAVPASLHASLMARLDRLGSAKVVAQIGAIIGRQFPYALIAAVAKKAEPELQSALDRLTEAGLLFRQGIAPHANYLFKHALVQDAAYGTLLREPRRALHSRIAETLENQFTEIAENQPELLARHYTEAGLIEKAAGLWGKAGQRSVERSALVEAVAQLTRALEQIATLPGTPALRRERIRLQVALITPLIHIKGYAAPETKLAIEQARRLLEQAETFGEPSEDTLQLFAVLYGLFVANVMAFNGDASRDIATHILELAEKQRASFPFVLGHNHLGGSLMFAGEIGEARAHLDRSITLYDPEHRLFATRFGEDQRVACLSMRSWVLWLLGYPEVALRGVDDALKEARETGQAASLMFALYFASVSLMLSGNYPRATALAKELYALADEKGALFWRMYGTLIQGALLASTGDAWNAVQIITSGMRPTGVTSGRPLILSNLARAYASLGQFDDARHCIGEATSTIETTKERWFEAEVNRLAGEIALISPERDQEKAEAYFEDALAVARKQQAKSWELRAAMSLACLWRDQGKPQRARELLAPVYDWFNEGFDRRDLKEARALLEELGS